MDNAPNPSTRRFLPTSASGDQPSHASTKTDQTHGTTTRSDRSVARNKSQQSKPVCRFFATKKGCRVGDQCRYQHNSTVETSSSDGSGNPPAESQTNFTQENPQARITIPTVFAARKDPASIQPISKPVSQAELADPREFQISQVVRRFSPFRADLSDTTTLKFRLNPTDPDFPFELETGLHCVLTIPGSYPQDGKPTLTVQNPEMARGFQINVEKGFEELVSAHPGKKLLAILNELDKNLERYLTSTKATTVKLVANSRKEPVPDQGPVGPVVAKTAAFVPAWTRYDSNQLRDAKTRRDAELRQLEARLGRSEYFSKGGDGVAFNVPLPVPISASTPVSLRSLRQTALIVPEVYPLEPCTIILTGVNGRDAENVEVAFEKRAVEKKDLTLMAHINYLTQNLGKLAADKSVPPGNVTVGSDADDGSASAASKPDNAVKEAELFDPARPHIRYMARPPEWDIQRQAYDSDDNDSSDYASEDDTDEEVESTVGGASLPVTSDSIVERGIQLSFPGLQTTGIELLQLGKLSITIKCDRCKEQADIRSITPSTSDGSSTSRSETCRKCSAPLTLKYRPELMHISSTKAGYLEVEACSIIDLLPSIFQPTCSGCSTTFPNPPGVTAVRGDSNLTICRSCHAKMSFTIPEVKFLHVSSATTASTLPLRAKKQKENLGINAGTPLPDSGRCTHYSKSYRWFRFSCCNRVFPCDHCHDEFYKQPANKEHAHPNEHAERMICGWCSREQRYHPESCRMCGRSVVKRSVTTGFWEGGKGTRDKNLMRKKEGRKYKVSGEEKKKMKEKMMQKEGKGKGGMWWPA